MKGLKIQNREINVQAFMDDLLFVLEDTKDSLKFLIQDLKEYGEVEGMKVNYQKTMVLLKNIKDTEKKN